MHAECRDWLQERAWYPVRVASARLAHIKYVTIYRASPVSAIDRVCRVARFTAVSGGEGYRVEREGEDELVSPIRANGGRHQVRRGTKYTTRDMLVRATSLANVLPIAGSA